MKELDLVLQRYLAAHWASADAAERAQFERVLELPDPELAACLLGHAQAPDPALEAMLVRLRGQATAGTRRARSNPSPA